MAAGCIRSSATRASVAVTGASLAVTRAYAAGMRASMSLSRIHAALERVYVAHLALTRYKSAHARQDVALLRHGSAPVWHDRPLMRARRPSTTRPSLLVRRDGWV